MGRPALEDFTPYKGQLFQLPGAAFGLVLEDATPDPLGFTLVFRGPAGAVLPADMYRLAHADGTTFELHLMPIHTPQPDRQNYQAVFS